jgi:hypothetical protein
MANHSLTHSTAACIQQLLSVWPQLTGLLLQNQTACAAAASRQGTCMAAGAASPPPAGHDGQLGRLT